MPAPSSHAETGTSSNVKVTVGGAPRKSNSLLRLLRATNRAAMPLTRIDSDAAFGSSSGSASMLPVFLVRNSELGRDAAGATGGPHQAAHHPGPAAERGKR